MDLDKLIELARANVHKCLNYSAQVCLSDAERLRDTGQDEYARQRALRSLLHSVGAFSGTYKEALK